MGRTRAHTGPAVLDGVVRYTSVSSLQNFDHKTEGGCEARWWFAKVAGKKEPESKSQALGVELHGQLEHWFLTGEDVLSPIVRAGKHLLPARGDDLRVEFYFGLSVERDWLRKTIPNVSDPLERFEMTERQKWVESQIDRFGTVDLMAGDIPVLGFIDLSHARGEYVDVAGVVQQEHGRVVEMLDHKTSSSIEKYAKDEDGLRTSIQMQGYDVVGLESIAPEAEAARSSHIVYQTRGAKGARKTSVLVPRAEALGVWRERTVPLAKKMRLVGQISLAENVDKNYSACSAFGGCPHQAYCPRSDFSIHDLFVTKEDTEMEGLFASLLKPEAKEAVQNGSSDLVQCAVCRTRGKLVTFSMKLTNGTCPSCNINIGAVNPPDGPKDVDLIDTADPLPADVIDAIEDPEIKKVATDHAAAHAAREQERATARAALEKPKPGGRCPGGGRRVSLDPRILAKKYLCPECSKELAIKPSADRTEATLPTHNRPKGTVAEAMPEIPGLPGDLAEPIGGGGDAAEDIPDLPVETKFTESREVSDAAGEAEALVHELEEAMQAAMNAVAIVGGALERAKKAFAKV